MQAVGPRWEALKWIVGCKGATSWIIPPCAQVDKVVVVQLAGESERLGGGAALGGAEGAEAEAGGGEKHTA
jgi:hypothetical protein